MADIRQRFCKDCGKELPYSDDLARSWRARGMSDPTRCEHCARIHARIQRTTAALGYCPTVPRHPQWPLVLASEGFGWTRHPDTSNTVESHEAAIERERHKFAISDLNIEQLYEALDRHQVVVVVGPTGSGKSTFVPYRLVAPPDGYAPDHFTRRGQVVVTSPRIAPTESTAHYVGKTLMGSGVGPRFEVNFRNSEAPSPTDLNRLVYATDGTIINWMRSGKLNGFSVLMIDEAHERSLNIDLILGLLKRQLPLVPHLRVIIASATIDANLFVDFFGGKEKVALLEFPGRTFGYTGPHYWPEDRSLGNGDQYMRTSARAAAELAVRLHLEARKGVREPGDVLVFSPTRRTIGWTIDELDELLGNEPILANIEVSPLHSQLPVLERERVLADRETDAPRRIVVATNIAETSLTVDGIRYVVDTGLQHRSLWDTEKARTLQQTGFHSQDGCRQRWGRAGRKMPGEVFTTYTESQYASFEEHTLPDIKQQPLESVVLNAKAVGVDDIAGFDWIEPPRIDEVARAEHALKALDALDEDSDITPRGLELAGYLMQPDYGSLLIEADRLCCLPEMAVVVTALSTGAHALFMQDSAWDGATRLLANRCREALALGCRDDVDLVVRVYRAWVTSPNAVEWAASHFVDHDLLLRIHTYAQNTVSQLAARKNQNEWRLPENTLLEKVRYVFARCMPSKLYARDEGASCYRPVADPESGDVGTAIAHIWDRSAAAWRSADGPSPPPAYIISGSQPVFVKSSRDGVDEYRIRFVIDVDPDRRNASEYDLRRYLTESPRDVRPLFDDPDALADVSLKWPLGSVVSVERENGSLRLLNVLQLPVGRKVITTAGGESSLSDAFDDTPPPTAEALPFETDATVTVWIDTSDDAQEASEAVGSTQHALEGPACRLADHVDIPSQSSFTARVVSFEANGTGVTPLVTPCDPLGGIGTVRQQLQEADDHLVAIRATVLDVYREGYRRTAKALLCAEHLSGAPVLIDALDMSLAPEAEIHRVEPGRVVNAIAYSADEELGAVRATRLPILQTGVAKALATNEGAIELKRVNDTPRGTVYEILSTSPDSLRGFTTFIPRGILNQAVGGPGPRLKATGRLPERTIGRAAGEQGRLLSEYDGTVGVTEDGRLFVDGSMPFAEYRRLVSLCANEKWHAAVTDLFRTSNSVEIGITGRVDTTPVSDRPAGATRTRPADRGGQTRIGVGTPFQGRVNNVVEFGVFVTLPDGRSGLIHKSNLKGVSPADFAKKGDPVTATIERIDGKGRLVLVPATSSPRQ